jgi:hypothetical protein
LDLKAVKRNTIEHLVSRRWLNSSTGTLHAENKFEKIPTTESKNEIDKPVALLNG